MGQGIAQVTASAGMVTLVFDAAGERARGAVSAIAARLERLVTKGTMDADQRTRSLASLRVADELRAACEGADLVIEAVPENLELKVHALGDAARAAPWSEMLADGNFRGVLEAAGARGIDATLTRSTLSDV